MLNEQTATPSQAKVRTVRDAVAFATVNPDNSITLGPFEGLANFDDGFYKMMQRGDFGASGAVNLIDVAEPGSLFFYTATQFKVNPKEFFNTKIAVEKGVGHLATSGTFIRDVVHSVHEATSHGPLTQTRTFGSPPYLFSNNDYVTVYSHAPENYQDALMLDHAVLCSIEAHTPSPVHLENNTVLGRTDGRIQSLDSAALKSLLGIQDTPRGITLRPTDDNSDKPRGTFYFSLDGNSLKFFDGLKVRTVQFREDN